MCAFDPTIRLIDPPIDSDPLGAALQRNLRRLVGFHLVWGPLLTLIAGILTLGIVPLAWQTTRFTHHAAVERNQWRHIAEWLGDLPDRSENLRVPLLWLIAITGSLLVGAFCIGLFIVDEKPITSLSLWGPKSGLARLLTLSVTLGFVFAYLMVLRHQHQTAQSIRSLNESVAANVAPPVVDFGLSIPCIAGALCFAGLGLPWGVLMMLAAGAQRRYITHTSVKMRAEIADHLRELAAARSTGAC